MPFDRGNSGVVQQAIPTFRLANVDSEKILYIWGKRLFMLFISIGILLMINNAWMKKSSLKKQSI